MELCYLLIDLGFAAILVYIILNCIYTSDVPEAPGPNHKERMDTALNKHGMNREFHLHLKLYKQHYNCVMRLREMFSRNTVFHYAPVDRVQMRWSTNLQRKPMEHDCRGVHETVRGPMLHSSWMTGVDATKPLLLRYVCLHCSRNSSQFVLNWLKLNTRMWGTHKDSYGNPYVLKFDYDHDRQQLTLTGLQFSAKRL